MWTLSNQFDVLNIDHKLILQYFIWTGLNDCFRNQLIQITGSNKPSLQQIEENIFTALERYRNVSQKFTEKKDKKQRVDAQTTTSLASAVNSKSSRANFKKCTLCLADDIKNIDHPIFKCTVYATPQSKMDKLQSLNFCTKLRIVDSISEINANIAVSGILSIFASLLIRLIIPVTLKCVAKVKMVMLQRNRNKFLWGLA